MNGICFFLAIHQIVKGQLEFICKMQLYNALITIINKFYLE